VKKAGNGGGGNTPGLDTDDSGDSDDNFDDKGSEWESSFGMSPVDEVQMHHGGMVSCSNYQRWFSQRPSFLEQEGAELVAEVAQVLQCGLLTTQQLQCVSLHLMSTCSAEAADIIAGASGEGVDGMGMGVGGDGIGRVEGLQLSLSTSAAYLLIAAEEIGDSHTDAKVSPPIGDADNREALWRAMGSGVIGIVGSGHSPVSERRMKGFASSSSGGGGGSRSPDFAGLVSPTRPGGGLGHNAGSSAVTTANAAGGVIVPPQNADFVRALNGTSALEVSLAAVWTAAKARGFTEVDLARWMCQKPAALLGLDGRKGRLEVSSDADILVWDPEESFTVEASRMHYRGGQGGYQGAACAPPSAFAGRTLSGVVKETYVRGVCVFSNGCVAERATGAIVRR
jgi:dihydroorotase-like cyclic amidohydrolase